jgi:ABC-2 type transport system permease protein
MVLTTLMGVRFAGGITGLLVLLLVLALISVLFTTLSLTLAFALRRHFELISIVMIISLPMVFMSTAFAPMAYMPSWLKFIVAFNPITLAVEPLRAVYFSADWTWGATVFSSPIADFNIATCLLVLLLLNLIMSFLARGVIRRKLF